MTVPPANCAATAAFTAAAPLLLPVRLLLPPLLLLLPLLLLVLGLFVCTCGGADQVDDNVGAGQGILRGSIILEVPVLEQHNLPQHDGGEGRTGTR